MANIKINNVSNLNTLVMELKSKVTISLTENVESIKATLSNINNYKNSGFSANVGDIANSLKNNLDNILSDITNASANYFNYASYINKFNVDDYNKSVNPVDLESQYNSIYLGKNEEKKDEKWGLLKALIIAHRIDRTENGHELEDEISKIWTIGGNSK